MGNCMELAGFLKKPDENRKPLPPLRFLTKPAYIPTTHGDSKECKLSLDLVKFQIFSRMLGSRESCEILRAWAVSSGEARKLLGLLS